MRAWIFQGNPDTFDLDKYLARTHEIVWTVRQKHFREDMREGDKVFLWRASGKAKAISGIIAAGHLSGEPQESEEDEASRGLWREGETGKKALRVPATLDDVETNNPLTRKQLKRDPILREMRILKLAAETNYLLQSREGKRLSRLWDNHVRGGETPLLTDELERVLGQREGRSGVPQESESVGEDAEYAVSSHPDAPDDDITQRQISARKVRGGQPMFRQNLLRAYGEKCSISGTGPREVLEAVHIIPHAESGINALDNGLLLRADLHNLFDDGLLRINPDSLMVELSSELRSTDYWELNGVRLRDRSDGSKQSREFLKQRWAEETS